MQRPRRRKLKTGWIVRDDSLSSKLNDSSFDRSRCHWPIDPFPLDIVLSPLRRLCRLWFESKPSWIICGLQWHMGRCLSVQMAVISSAVAYVGNGSVRGAIACLNVEKWVYNDKRDYAGRIVLFALHACHIFDVIHRLRDKRDKGAICSSCVWARVFKLMAGTYRITFQRHWPDQERDRP